MATTWSGIVDVARTLWVAFDGFVVTAVSPFMAVNVAWALASIPVWLLFGLATWASNRGTVNNVTRKAELGEATVPEVSRYGRQAAHVAMAIVIVALVGPPLTALPTNGGIYNTLVGVLVYDVLCGMFAVCLLRLNLDLYRNDRLAGGYAKIAYLLATLGAANAFWVGWSLAWIIGAANYQSPF
jgi:hypothetical protein